MGKSSLTKLYNYTIYKIKNIKVSINEFELVAEKYIRYDEKEKLKQQKNDSDKKFVNSEDGKIINAEQYFKLNETLQDLYTTYKTKIMRVSINNDEQVTETYIRHWN